ncbi:hypothetical protein DFH29DRAFT_1075848 [Suillus ampliporus]|nr:hypothetical protein DFH29DRAFT_1075848 [Suillus ampliporus]
MQTVNSQVNLCLASDIIDALQNILHSRAIIVPDLETPYSRATFPNPNHCVDQLKDHSISTIVTERQQQLGTVLRDISGLDTVMDGINNLRKQLVDQKEKIVQSMDLHKRLGSALWRLPTEVLSHIFIHCLPKGSEPTYLSSPSKLAPMLLTRVCRRWREVAMGVPNLWCSVHMEVDDGGWKGGISFYDSWLKRSRGCPLLLNLDCYYASDLTKLRGLLQPYTNQISSLFLRFSRKTIQPELLFKDPPALQELTIRRMHYERDIPSNAQSFSRLPSTLRSLNIIEVIGWTFDIENLSSFNPVWTHLTNVEITILHPNAFLHLLRLCPNLSSLTVRAIFGQKQTLKPLTHTAIRSIHLDFDAAHIFPLSNLLDALSLPNLQVLDARNIGTWPHEAVKAFLIQSKCPLESLTVSGRVRMTDEQRAEYADLFPSLKVVLNFEY